MVFGLPVLRVVTSNRPPYVFHNEYAANNSKATEWYGMLVDLLPMVFNAAKTDASFSYYKAPTDEGGSLVNGSWTGIIGEITKGNADIAAFPLTLSPGRTDVIDMSYPFYTGGLGMLVKKLPASGHGVTTFLQPFQTSLWVALIFTVIGITVVLYLISFLSPYGCYQEKKIRNVSAKDQPATKFVIEDKNGSFLVDALMATMLNAPMPGSSSWSIRIPSLVFYAFMMIVIAAFTANLASVLTVNATTSVASSLVDLRRDNLPFIVNSGGADLSYFRNSVDPNVLAVQGLLQTAIGQAQSLAVVQSGAVTAYFAQLPVVLYAAGQAPCNLEVVGPVIGPGLYCFALPKNSSYTSIVNRGLLQLSESGLLNQVQRRWIDDQSVCKDVQVSNLALGISDFAGLWYILFAAIGLGILVAATERILSAILTRSPAARNFQRRLKKRFSSTARSTL
ncbi:glutamate receptor [Klebsormidium nitens]|uniref:Glutamate receptor n=1 Tax=Klebsormidium nitens TaxID=105231 RepID=A0A1Y1I809_KLENI|nr:glutamate receptor [Klebsormidium nitens]|eukprot:GAQ85569.1 glutamate receptor [Klebsormidium nitens]